MGRDDAIARTEIPPGILVSTLPVFAIFVHDRLLLRETWIRRLLWQARRGRVSNQCRKVQRELLRLLSETPPDAGRRPLLFRARSPRHGRACRSRVSEHRSYLNHYLTRNRAPNPLKSSYPILESAAGTRLPSVAAPFEQRVTATCQRVIVVIRTNPQRVAEPTRLVRNEFPREYHH